MIRAFRRKRHVLNFLREIRQHLVCVSLAVSASLRTLSNARVVVRLWRANRHHWFLSNRTGAFLVGHNIAEDDISISIQNSCAQLASRCHCSRRLRVRLRLAMKITLFARISLRLASGVLRLRLLTLGSAWFPDGLGSHKLRRQLIDIYEKFLAIV